MWETFLFFLCSVINIPSTLFENLVYFQTKVAQNENNLHLKHLLDSMAASPYFYCSAELTQTAKKYLIKFKSS